ncbi:MAG: hypothetical protein PHO15_02620 [Eubacteriales bacterium]|nr:hypothetical protein [Eubacteriales bacterium]
MKKLISFLLMVILLLPSSIAFAEGEDTAEPSQEVSEAAEFAIDTQYVYPGMDKSYAQGYMPSVSDGTATVVLPLVVSGGAACDAVTASLELGDPSTAPFVFKNYVNDFPFGAYTVAGGDASCCLVSFCLELQTDRLNGSYPVVVHAEGTTQDGAALSGDFTLYVVIEDGKSAEAEATQEAAAVPQPKLIVEEYECSAELEAGAEAVLTVTVKNTSASQTVKNIKLSFQDGSWEILPAATGSVYIEKIKKGESAICGFDIRVAEDANARAHVLTVTMEYENSDATAFSSSDTIVLDVTQPIRLEYEQPTLPTKVTEGDNVSFSMNIMNLGKGIVYNVLLTFEIPGLNNGGSVLVGNLQLGESKEAATNLLVSSMNGEYGDTSGAVLLSYENEAGEQFERKIVVQTHIEKKIVAASADTQESEDKDEGTLPWWALGVGGIVIIGVAGLLTVKMVKSKRQRYIDERNL